MEGDPSARIWRRESKMLLIAQIPSASLGAGSSLGNDSETLLASLPELSPQFIV
jgi:hypothetical protein